MKQSRKWFLLHTWIKENGPIHANRYVFLYTSCGSPGCEYDKQTLNRGEGMVVFSKFYLLSTNSVYPKLCN